MGTRLRAGRQEFNSQQGQGMFLFSITSRPTLRSRWLPVAVSLTVKRQATEADHSSPPSAEVKKGGAMSPLPHTSSWRGA
jgi:hypothetical protein